MSTLERRRIGTESPDGAVRRVGQSHGLALTLFAVLLSLLKTTPAPADEGMWTFDRFPSEKVEQAYGFKPDRAWLEHLELSVLRFNRQGSASFVSPQGLVQTAHHAVRSCLERLSTKKQDLIARGFYAEDAKEELPCPGLELDQLLAITDVTGRLQHAGGEMREDKASGALAAEKDAIVKECTNGDASLVCELVELHGGAVTDLYKFRRYRDVRLVFAPEAAMADFGGHAYNFEFPRYAFDVAFVRVYADGKPLDTSANYLRYSEAEAQPGDIAFALGSPGYTERLLTLAELEYQRDAQLPSEIVYVAGLFAALNEFATRGAKQARSAESLLHQLDNRLKSMKGRFAALVDADMMNQRSQRERALRDKIAADPELQAQYGAAWEPLSAIMDKLRRNEARYQFTVYADYGFRSRLFDVAQLLVRPRDETASSEDLVERVWWPLTLDLDVEKLTLGYALAALEETVGPDDPLAKEILGGQPPRQRAAELVSGTGLAAAKTRVALAQGAHEAIVASVDPMLALARSIDEDVQTIAKEYRETIEAPQARYDALVAGAAFAVGGDEVYPDASYTPRISYGAVAGYRIDDRSIDPTTTIGRLFEHAVGSGDLKLPERWLAARGRLNLGQPLNIATSNDVVGGNSGGPLVNKAGEVIGVVFDLNRQGLGGYFVYDPKTSRAVSLTVGAIREGLAKVYHADRLVAELAQ